MVILNPNLRSVYSAKCVCHIRKKLYRIYSVTYNGKKTYAFRWSRGTIYFSTLAEAKEYGRSLEGN